MSQDERLRRELRALPRESASDGFTPQLMRRLEDERHGEASRPRRGGAPWSAALVAAGALLLLLAGWQGLRSHRATSSTPTLARGGPAHDATAPEVQAASRRDLEREAAAVRQELERLRRLAAARDSVIAIPGSGDYDYYIDLRPVLERGSVTSNGIDRAVYRTPRRGERP